MKENSFEEISIEFASKKEEELYAFAMVGERARDFFTSEIGRYIIGRAADEIEEVKEQLLKTPTWNKRKINRLQQQAKAAQAGIRWLQEAISEGDYAHEALLQMRE
ncbi:MAG: hypothetical protein RQ714_06585 [Nitrosomonas sp.]|nr:hypothetical protein [Nitrosomonas sp.]